MRKCLFLFLLLSTSVSVHAQSILKGDMNSDDQVSIADVTSLVNVILGKTPQETINLSVDPYKVDNATVVGTWYAPDGSSFTFKEDGTTTFPGGATYEFMPMQGRLLVYDAMKRPVKVLPLVKVESEYLLTIDYATSVFTYYTNKNSLATGITVSPSSLTINTGATSQLTATLSPATAIGSIMWSSSNKSIASVDGNGKVTGVAGGSCTITATAGGSLVKANCSVTVNQLVTSIQLSQTSLNLALDAYARLTATVLPSNASNTNVVWSSSDENVATVRNGRVDAYGLGTAVITCEAADGSGTKATCKVTVFNGEAVDLGLPSGTLWATCNVGASSPYQYGDFFAWGETEGYDSGKRDFSWTTYKWCEGSQNTLTKYCTNSDYGTVDNKTELDLDDDAAYVNWGTDWCTPSKEQFEELINTNYTTCEWTTLNNVNGYVITSKTNGNTIFLPTSFDCNGTSTPYASSSGYYWSRTLGYSPRAYSLRFSSSNIYSGDLLNNRSRGKSIRPVRSPE